MKKNNILFIIFLFILSSTLPSYSQNESDTIILTNKITQQESKISDQDELKFEKFTPKQLIIPGALMVSGLIGAIAPENNVNKSVKDAMTGLSNNNNCKVDDYLRFIPSASHLLLGCIGVQSRHNFKERFLISATSHAAMIVMGYGSKFIIHEKRPDFSDNRSFPSGHVALAFTGAELIRSEYGTAYGIAGYAVASGVAFLRLYNNKHWFNDVLMGAGIGILSARIGYWLLPFERKLFKINKKNSSSSTVAVIPLYNAFDKTYMMSFNAVF